MLECTFKYNEMLSVWTKRSWSTSRNRIILIILYRDDIMYTNRCDQGDEENKVMFYLNEGVYDYPGCNVGLCSWKFVENKFKEYLGPNDCNEVCHDQSRASSVRGVLLATVLLTSAVLAFTRA